MRVEFKMDGGVGFFPGLRAPVVIDSATLPAEDANQLDLLIEQAGIWKQQPDLPPTLSGAADHRHYTMRFEDRTAACTVEASDPIADPCLRDLVMFLDREAKAIRRAARSARITPPTAEE